MSASQVDPRPHSDAVVALLETALAPDVHAYTDDKVPGSPRNSDETERGLSLPDEFAVVSVLPRYVPPTGVAARSTRGAWRITVRCVGSTVRECQWVASRVTGALRNKTYTVGGSGVSVFFETAQDPTPDTERYSSLVTFTANH